MARRHAEDPLSNPLQVYQRAFEASPDYISISRLADGVYIDVNPGFQRLTGHAYKDVVGQSALNLGIWPDPSVRDAFIAHVRAGNKHPFTCELGLRDGGRRSVEVAGNITDVNGEGVLVAVARDVSERKLAEAELERYRAHLEQLVAQRTEALEQAHEQLKKAHEQAVKKEELSRYQSQHDKLTGLPNRALLYDRLAQLTAQAQRRRTPCAALFVDLDNFKHINDSHGHHAGDSVLQATAKRLRELVRKSDTVARLGGDEFIVVLSEVADEKGPSVIAQKILDTVSQPIPFQRHALHVGVSVGIAVYPRDATTADELIQAADTAMYKAKAMGRGNYQFHDGSPASAPRGIARPHRVKKA